MATKSQVYHWTSAGLLLVSAGLDGGPDTRRSTSPSVNNGGDVAFQVDDWSVEDGGPEHAQVYFAATNVVPVRLSLTADGGPGNGASTLPAVDESRWVAFATKAPDLVPVTGGAQNAVVRVDGRNSGGRTLVAEANGLITAVSVGDDDRVLWVSNGVLSTWKAGVGVVSPPGCTSVSEAALSPDGLQAAAVCVDPSPTRLYVGPPETLFRDGGHVVEAPDLASPSVTNTGTVAFLSTEPFAETDGDGLNNAFLRHAFGTFENLNAAADLPTGEEVFSVVMSNDGRAAALESAQGEQPHQIRLLTR